MGYQKRVAEEKAALDEKLERLSAFVNSPEFRDVPYDQKVLLEHQVVLMKEYSEVLSARIALFTEVVQPEVEEAPPSSESEAGG
jgi:hypothetical protein